MVTPSIGSVVLVSFPFSDLTRSKVRPAVVLADASNGDGVLCQVTSNAYSDVRACELTDESFAAGSLRITSYARPGKLFTANSSLMVRKVGLLKEDVLQQIIEAVVAMLHREVAG